MQLATDLVGRRVAKIESIVPEWTDGSWVVAVWVGARVGASGPLNTTHSLFLTIQNPEGELKTADAYHVRMVDSRFSTPAIG